MHEPDLYEAHYDLDLHETPAALCPIFEHVIAPRCATRWSPASRSPRTVQPIASRSPRDSPSRKAFLVLELACERGFVPPRTGWPLRDPAELWNQATACVAFLWEHRSELLSEQIGEAALLAPPPETARNPRCSPWGE
jgi:hypothetical protein